MSTADFPAYCACESGFKSLPVAVRNEQPWRRFECRECGALKPEWRCPIHGLKAAPVKPDRRHVSIGCPACAEVPVERRVDPYMLDEDAVARHRAWNEENERGRQRRRIRYRPRRRRRRTENDTKENDMNTAAVIEAIRAEGEKTREELSRLIVGAEIARGGSPAGEAERVLEDDAST